MKGYLVNLVRAARRGRDGPGEALPRPVRNPVAMLDATWPPAESNDERAPLVAIRQDAGSTAAPTGHPAPTQDHARPGDDIVPFHAHDRTQAPTAPVANLEIAGRREHASSDAVAPPPNTPGGNAPWPSATVVSREPSEASPREQPWPAARAQARTEWKAAVTQPVPRAAPVAQPVTALPDIHVTIGRIEVRADLAAPAPKAAPPRRQPVMSLAQYEARRREGSR
jgi:hypothetical protein